MKEKQEKQIETVFRIDYSLRNIHSEKMDSSRGDPALRDKKKLPMADLFVAFPMFLGFLLLVPIWIGVMIPLALLSQTVGSIVSLLVPAKRPTKPQMKDSIELKVLKQNSDSEGRIYDIVVFGATGFTGKMAAVYIAKNYGTQFRWAIAGRRRDALEKVRDELLKHNEKLTELGIEIADSFVDASLGRLASSTKVIITAAGTAHKKEPSIFIVFVFL
jgi:hypothetical protein